MEIYENIYRKKRGEGFKNFESLQKLKNKSQRNERFLWEILEKFQITFEGRVVWKEFAYHSP